MQKLSLHFRALAFLANNFGGVIPAIDLTEADSELLALINRDLKEYLTNLEKLRWAFSNAKVWCFSVANKLFCGFDAFCKHEKNAIGMPILFVFDWLS